MKKGQKQAIAVGAGAAAVAAAAAGIFLLTGKRGEKNRRKISQWSVTAKKDVLAEIKKLEKVSKQTYNQAVDTVAKRYKALKKVDAGELAGVVAELKGHWDSIYSHLNQAGRSVKRVTPKKAASKKAAPKKAPAKKKAKK